MLELYFKYPGVLERLRSGALGGEMDRIAARFSEIGYARASARVYLDRIARFSQFASKAGHRDSVAIGQDLVERYLLAIEAPSVRVGAQTAIRHVLRLIQERLPVAREHRTPDPDWQLLAAYDEHLCKVRGLQPRTRQGRILAARRMLGWYKEHVPGRPLSAMTGENVLALVSQLLSLSVNDYTRSATVSHVRSFLRFLRWAGLIEEELARLVPRVPCWRMAHLPPRLAWEEVRRVVDAIDVTDPSGVRDRAVLLLLATTGMRSRELRLLELQDIRWRAGEVVVRRTKARRDRVVPLLEEVGDALAEYVLHARPKTQAPQVFLCHRPPARPLRSSSTLAALVRRRLERCDLQLPRAGAHLLRHSLATQLVGQKRPIKEVADLLGHRNIDTTAIYVKVALPQLATVPLPYPGSKS
jgi:site-specific recombinase XerD